MNTGGGQGGGRMIWFTVGALAVALLGPLGYRLDLLPLLPSLLLPVVGALAALVTLGLAVYLLLRPTASRARALVVILLAVPLVSLVGWQLVAVARAPPIHDITTDLEVPPKFGQVHALRPPHANPLQRTAETDRQQLAAYPHIQPLYLGVPSLQVRALVARLVEERGWQLHPADHQSLLVEATATTRLYGFADDIIIRLTPVEGGTRVDMRSVSRIGVSDLGTNARRIRDFLADLERAADDARPLSP